MRKYESGAISSATYKDFDALVYERNRAILEGNDVLADSIMEQIYKIGGRSSTPEEIVGVAAPNGIVAANSGSFEFRTIDYPVRVNNKNYSVRQITCLVMPGCNLYHNASINTKNITANTRAASFNVCKAVGSTFAGAVNPYTAAALTVYDVLRGYVSDISPNTIIEDITANYTYTIIEQCTFYSYKVNNTWTPYAVTSYVETEVDAIIMGVSYNGGNFTHIDNKKGTYSGDFYANKSTYTPERQLSTYLNSYLVNYVSQITGVVIQDTNGRTLLNRGMVAPHNTSEIR